MKLPPALAALAIALAVPGTGAASDDETEPNNSVTRLACAGGIAELRLQADNEGDDGESGGEIEIELRVDGRWPVPTWRLVLLHERRLIYQGIWHSSRDGYALRYRREVPDWEGRQTVAARLAAPSGRSCRLEATI